MTTSCASWCQLCQDDFVQVASDLGFDLDSDVFEVSDAMQVLCASCPRCN